MARVPSTASIHTLDFSSQFIYRLTSNIPLLACAEYSEVIRDIVDVRSVVWGLSLWFETLNSGGKIMRKTVSGLACLGFLTMSSVSALAGSVGTSMDVSANVITSCIVGTPTAVVMGDILDNGFVQDGGTFSIEVTCSAGAAYAIAIGYGLNPAGTDRQMNSGSSLLTYHLYHPGGFTQFWGESPDHLVVGSATGALETYTGGIRTQPGASTTSLGLHSDTVSVTINY